MVGCVGGAALLVEDAPVDAASGGGGELSFGASKTALPLKFVEVLAVFGAKDGVVIERFCKLIDDARQYLPTSWAEIGAKRESARYEEQL